jgi:hypothetical protein
MFGAAAGKFEKVTGLGTSYARELIKYFEYIPPAELDSDWLKPDRGRYGKHLVDIFDRTQEIPPISGVVEGGVTGVAAAATGSVGSAGTGSVGSVGSAASSKSHRSAVISKDGSLKSLQRNSVSENTVESSSIGTSKTPSGKTKTKCMSMFI